MFLYTGIMYFLNFCMWWSWWIFCHLLWSYTIKSHHTLLENPGLSLSPLANLSCNKLDKHFLLAPKFHFLFKNSPMDLESENKLYANTTFHFRTFTYNLEKHLVSQATHFQYLIHLSLSRHLSFLFMIPQY